MVETIAESINKNNINSNININSNKADESHELSRFFWPLSRAHLNQVDNVSTENRVDWAQFKAGTLY